MSTMDGNNDDNRRTSPRFKVKKDKKDDTENNNGNSPTKKCKSDEYDDGKGTEGADAVSGTSARKKQKVEDDAEKKRKEIMRTIKPEQQKQTVMVNDEEKKCSDVNNTDLKELIRKHKDKNDPFYLNKRQLSALSVTRELWDDVKGNPGKRCAQNSTKYKDGTPIEGASEKERMVSNLSEYLANPGNACGGSDKAGFKDLRKEQAANGKGVNDYNGNNAKQETLGGAPLSLIVGSKHVQATNVQVNGDPFVELVVLPSTQKGIDDSEGRNRTDLLLTEAGYSVSDQKATGSKELKKMKNATGTLRTVIADKIGMAQHPRNRKGTKSYPNDPLPWYNMGMIFYFKGRKEDVAQYQQKVEKPSEEEVAMLVKKRDEKLAQMK